MGRSTNIPAFAFPAFKLVNKVAELVGRQNVLSQIKRARGRENAVDIDGIISRLHNRVDVTCDQRSTKVLSTSVSNTRGSASVPLEG